MNDTRLTKTIARLRKAWEKGLSALDTLIGECYVPTDFY
jgi:hypothetical protein